MALHDLIMRFAFRSGRKIRTYDDIHEYVYGMAASVGITYLAIFHAEGFETLETRLTIVQYRRC